MRRRTDRIRSKVQRNGVSVTGASCTILSIFLAMAERVEETLGSGAVAKHWQDPSALEGYSVAGLAGHLARGVLTVEKYLQAPAPSEDSEATDAPGYVVAVLDDQDPVDSDFHRAVRARSLETAAGGAASLAREVRETRERLARHLNDAIMDQRIKVFQGVV